MDLLTYILVQQSGAGQMLNAVLDYNKLVIDQLFT